MKPRSTAAAVCLSAVLLAALGLGQREEPRHSDRPATYREIPDDPWMPRSTMPPDGVIAHSEPVVRGLYVSIQVNTDLVGRNIVGDAANEPSIAIDPRDPSRIVIGWRQFDTVASNFRLGGYAYSEDAGHTWTFPGVLEPGVFSSDPVLDADPEGNFYYYSLQPDRGPDDWQCYLYKSFDGGATWPQDVYAFGGDKAWMVIDRTGGIGHGNVYFAWDRWGCCGSRRFTRSTDGGRTFSRRVGIPSSPEWGTISVGPDGEVYVAGRGFVVAKSTKAPDPALIPTFDFSVTVDLGGRLVFNAGGPNPGGLLGQAWIATDHSDGPTRGNVYLLASVDPSVGSDPLNVKFSRSTDGGATWSTAIRVNRDPPGTDAWQWFGTMSVAPNGRIDVIWNDTRNTGAENLSELFYASSTNGGVNWVEHGPVSPVFDSHVGWPNQNKLGDYYDMISDNAGVNIAYAATFNGEQDVYFVRIGMRDCNENGISDKDDITAGTSRDCDRNQVPDECQRDCNTNGVPDSCDVSAGGLDCDGNNNPDECDPDYDHDGTIDGCDFDIDGDGIWNGADMCEFSPLGQRVNEVGGPFSDIDQDCDVDLIDYSRFRYCIARGGPDVLLPVSTCPYVFDYNGDQDVDLEDFAGFQEAFSAGTGTFGGALPD